MLRALKNHLPAPLAKSLRGAVSLVPARWRKPPSYWRWRRFLARAQWWSGDEIERWQIEHLRSVIAFAYENTTGYRALYRQAGVHPRDIQCLADVRRLPFVTKSMLQADLEAFSVRRPFREYVTTGGSTGIPFGFYKLAGELSMEEAFMHTGWTWIGWRPDMPSAVLRGGVVGSTEKPWEFDRYRNELVLSSYHLTEANVAEYLGACDRYAPAVIHAYPSSLNLLCDLVAERSPKSRLPFHIVLLGSENLYDWQISKFETLLPGARMFSWYGHMEMAVLAPWCEHRRENHVWPFYGHMELLDSGGREVEQGRLGEIVATSFHSGATPFIRYRTMDMAEKGSQRCPDCGRQFRLLTKISGRAQEFIVTSTGRYISMTAMNMHDAIFDNLRQFQFLQDAPGVIRFLFIPKSPLSLDQQSSIRVGLQRKLGDDVKCELREVNEIPRTRAGKCRFLDQRLPIRYRDDQP